MHYDLSALWEKAQAMFDGFIALLPNLLLGGLLLAVFVLLGKWVHRLGVRMAHRVSRRGNLGLILGNLFQWLFVGLGLLIALSIVIPSFEARNLIELLGIGTVAVGFAFRDILQNFFAGILILITEPFELDDEITVAGFEGTVQTIETRATTIRTFDGRRVVIPNTTLFTQAVVVTSADEKLRTTYDVELPRDCDLEAARARVVAAVRAVEGVVADPTTDAVVTELGSSNVKLRVRWWTDSAAHVSVNKVRSLVLQAIRDALPAEAVKPAEAARS